MQSYGTRDGNLIVTVSEHVISMTRNAVMHPIQNVWENVQLLLFRYALVKYVHIKSKTLEGCHHTQKGGLVLTASIGRTFLQCLPFQSLQHN